MRSEHLPGLEVVVTVNGNDLKECPCNDKSETARTTTTHVEAVTGQTFAVGLKVDRDCQFVGDALSFDVEIDGTHVDDGLFDALEEDENLQHLYRQGLWEPWRFW